MPLIRTWRRRNRSSSTAFTSHHQIERRSVQRQQDLRSALSYFNFNRWSCAHSGTLNMVAARICIQHLSRTSCINTNPECDSFIHSAITQGAHSTYHTIAIITVFLTANSRLSHTHFSRAVDQSRHSNKQHNNPGSGVLLARSP